MVEPRLQSYLTKEEEAQISAIENAPPIDYTEELRRIGRPVEMPEYEAPKKEAGFWSSFKDSFTTLLDLPEAIDYGIKSDDTTRNYF